MLRVNNLSTLARTKKNCKSPNFWEVVLFWHVKIRSAAAIIPYLSVQFAEAVGGGLPRLGWWITTVQTHKCNKDGVWPTTPRCCKLKHGFNLVTCPIDCLAEAKIRYRNRLKVGFKIENIMGSGWKSTGFLNARSMMKKCLACVKALRKNLSCFFVSP